MEENTMKDALEDKPQHLNRLVLEMADLIESIHNLQIELTKIREEYAALP